MIELMITAASSGSGKTVITCGMLTLLKRLGMNARAFKCGPDYIDPMFHRAVLGVESRNLDLFFCKEEQIKEKYVEYIYDCDVAVCEGVMGYYDGLGGTTTQGSAWHLTDTLNLPVLLVVKPKGMSLTVAAQIKGLCAMRTPHHIKGVILNECTEALYKTLKNVLEEESGIPILGYLPPLEEARFESRHLGLYTASEIEGLWEKINRIADELEKNLDMERFYKLFKSEREISKVSCRGGETKTTIAVARDEAFCFIYEETLDILRKSGAELVFFSPLKDTAIPEKADALYLPGGYPELYAKELSENISVKKEIKKAIDLGMPVVAECGGFLYLGKSLQGSDGRFYDMADVLEGTAEKKQRLVRFGYVNLTAKKDSLLFRVGENVPAHEFHYWDSSHNGEDISAEKPVSGRKWNCCFTSDSMYAGFPHLYFAGTPVLAQRFINAAEQYGKNKAKEVPKEKACGGIGI